MAFVVRLGSLFILKKEYSLFLETAPKAPGGGSRRRRGEGLPSPKGGECGNEAKRSEDGGTARPRALLRLLRLWIFGFIY